MKLRAERRRLPARDKGPGDQAAKEWLIVAVLTGIVLLLIVGVRLLLE